MKSIYKGLLLLAFSLSAMFAVQAQNSKKDREKAKEVATERMISSRNFIFVAQSVNPPAGRTIQLTSEYDVQVSNDKIATYLPYFGRAFIAPYNATDGGYRFTSTDFGYSVQARKKGGWDITILPKDANDVRQMFLTVTPSGYASLQMISNNRQAISYNGYVTEKK